MWKGTDDNSSVCATTEDKDCQNDEEAERRILYKVLSTNEEKVKEK